MKRSLEQNMKENTQRNTNQNTDQHEIIHPSILYYGTPVLLLSTLNEDGSTNLSPLSSSWALGDCLVLGMGVQGKAYENLNRHPECVVNLPDVSMWRQVEALGRYTGIDPVPEGKKEMGYTFCADKFTAAGLTSQGSIQVAPVKVAECPLQIEAVVQHIRVPEHTPFMAIVEVRALQVHAHTRLISGLNKINPAEWNPLIYNFRHYYGLGERRGENFRASK